jgi:hypothetical protein
MVKEPNELSAARASLKKSAEDFGDPGRLVHLRNGISSLAEVLAGECAQIQKDISKKLALTYRNKLLSEVKVVVANMDSYDPESLGPSSTRFESNSLLNWVLDLSIAWHRWTLTS